MLEKIDRLPPVLEDLVLRMANNNIAPFERNNCYTSLAMIYKDIGEYLNAYEKEVERNQKRN